MSTELMQASNGKQGGPAPASMMSAARREASLITPCAAAAISCVLSAAFAAAALLLLLPVTAAPALLLKRSFPAGAGLWRPPLRLPAAASAKLVHTLCGLDSASLPDLALSRACEGRLGAVGSKCIKMPSCMHTWERMHIGAQSEAHGMWMGTWQSTC